MDARALFAAIALSSAVPMVFADAPHGASRRTHRETERRDRVERAIDTSARRYLSTDTHTPWQIVHGIKAFGWDLELDQSRERDGINAIEYLCFDAKVGGRRVFARSEHGVRAVDGPGMQGHPDQFLSALAQAGVPLDYPIEIDGRTYTVADMVNHARHSYRRGQEASWTLIALSTYLDPEETWVNYRGEPLTLEDLVEDEIAVEPTSAACGGTHNLYALAYALNRYRESGGSVVGAWKRAAHKLARYHKLTQSLQNSDGSLSSNYYAGRSRSEDATDQLSTTGHTLEWLTLYVSDDELNSEWFTRAIDALVSAFERTSTQPVDCGALYHATRALVQYQRRHVEAPLALTEQTNSKREKGRAWR